jgi:hypothetical protein
MDKNIIKETSFHLRVRPSEEFFVTVGTLFKRSHIPLNKCVPGVDEEQALLGITR